METNTNSITVIDFAKKNADSALINGDLHMFSNFLTQLFNLIINDLKIKDKDNKTLIDGKEKEIDELNLEISLKTKTVNEKKTIIQTKQLELKDAENGVIDKPWLEITFLSIGLLLLTVFLWIYYVACLYGSINAGIFKGTTNILSSALDSIKSLFPIDINSLFYLIFPVIFILIGYFAHSKRLNSKLFKSSLVAVTFFVDCILGYIMASNIYEENRRIDEKPWEFPMVFTDKYFYLLIFMGFVAYLIWGFVFNQINNILEQTKPSKRIISLRTELSELENDVKTLENDIEKKLMEVKQAELFVSGLKMGKIPFSKAKFKGDIATSKSEWHRSYKHFSPSSQDNVMDLFDKYQTEWEKNTYSNPPTNIIILD